MVDYEGFPGVYAAGQDAGNFFKKVADKAANTACSLYRNYPGAILPANLFRVPNPISAVSRGIWDSLCAPPERGGLPPPPTVPFSGGQCACTSYLINYQVINEDTGAVSNLSVTLPGKVGGVFRRPSTTVPNVTVTGILHSIGCNGSTGIENVLGSGTNPYRRRVVITQVRTANNSPDTCGNPPPQYPPIDLPDNQRNQPVTINNNDGTNITIPFAYVPISPTANISIQPNFTVDVGGIKVDFNAGGVTLNTGSGGTPGNPGTDLSPVLDGLDSLGDKIDGLGRNSPTSPINDPSQKEEDNRTENDPKEESGIEGLSSVCIILSSVPRTAREQSGGDGEDVVYAGWFEFRIDDCFLPREPIHFRRSCFKAPEGANGFSYTLYSGFRGSAKITRIKPTPG